MKRSELSAVFKEHKDAVYGFAYRMTGSAFDAEEVCQDCFLALLGDAATFDPRRGTWRCFLIGVTRNLVLKRWRSEGRFDTIEDHEGLVEPVDPSSRETSELVAQAVGALPPLQREALILAEYEGFTLKEIAETVEAEVGTVKARLHRARQNLRHALAPLAPTAGVKQHATTQ